MLSTPYGQRQPPCRRSLVPSLADRVAEFGLIGLRCRLEMWLEVGTGLSPVSMRFAVDTGAACSFIDLVTAEARGLSVPPASTETDVTLLTARGTARIRVRPGRIRGWWSELQHGHPFDWPVLFRVGAQSNSPAILGLGGVLHTCRWIFDGSYSRESPHGQMILEDTR